MLDSAVEEDIRSRVTTFAMNGWFSQIALIVRSRPGRRLEQLETARLVRRMPHDTTFRRRHHLPGRTLPSRETAPVLVAERKPREQVATDRTPTCARSARASGRRP